MAGGEFCLRSCGDSEEFDFPLYSAFAQIQYQHEEELQFLCPLLRSRHGRSELRFSRAAQFNKKILPQAETILELGCGTGTNLSLLSRHFEVAGLDLSPAMIRLARRKVPAARLAVGDITSFKLNQKFDVVLCIFDTMNHLLTFRSWQDVFHRAQAHLNPGGVFIFDINTRYKLELYSHEPPFVIEALDAVSIINIVKTSLARYCVDIKLFKKDGQTSYRLHEMQLQETTFPAPRILKALKRHFSKVTLLDLDRRKANAKTEELYFICRPPRKE